MVPKVQLWKSDFFPYQNIYPDDFCFLRHSSFDAQFQVFSTRFEGLSCCKDSKPQHQSFKAIRKSCRPAKKWEGNICWYFKIITNMWGCISRSPQPICILELSGPQKRKCQKNLKKVQKGLHGLWMAPYDMTQLFFIISILTRSTACRVKTSLTTTSTFSQHFGHNSKGCQGQAWHLNPNQPPAIVFWQSLNWMILCTTVIPFISYWKKCQM